MLKNEYKLRTEVYKVKTFRTTHAGGFEVRLHELS